MKKVTKEDVIKFRTKYKMILLLFFVAIIALIIGLVMSFGFDKEKLATKEGEKMTANTKADVIKEETYEGLKFTNISLIAENGYSTFSADVTNTTQTDSKISDVNIVWKDKDGNEVITLRGNIGEPLKPNETRTITAVTKGNLKDVTAKVINKYENIAQN